MRYQPHFSYRFKYFLLLETFQNPHFDLGDPVPANELKTEKSGLVHYYTQYTPQYAIHDRQCKCYA